MCAFDSFDRDSFEHLEDVILNFMELVPSIMPKTLWWFCILKAIF